MKNIVTRRTFLGGSMAAVGALATARLRRASGQTPVVLDAEERERVEAAVPTKAFATPKRRRRPIRTSTAWCVWSTRRASPGVSAACGRWA